MKLLSIIIPAYNSERNIENLINDVKNMHIPMIKKEIIVVNDCSTDNTKKILQSIKDIIVLNHKKNTGKGGALKTGISIAHGDIIFIQDDDFEYNPYDIQKIILPIFNGESEIIFGSRALSKKNTGYFTFERIFINKLLSLLIGFKLTDPITGSKAFSKKALSIISPLQSNGFEVETEIVAKAIKKGLKPKEVSISYNPRSISEGKNIRWYHAFPIIFGLIKFLIIS